MADEIKNEVAEENTEATETSAGADTKDAKAKKKGKKKWPIVLGIVVVVVIAAGAGFMVWHEQPSFCNAICHTPMDAYVETYIDGTTDAYGNELEDEDAQNAMMAYLHGNSLEDGETVDCLDCHVPQLGEQITEALNWVTGSYEIEGTNSNGDAVLTERTLEDLVEARGIDEDEFCLNENCHHVDDDGNEILTRDDLVEATADLDDTYNPHLSQHGEVACSECHKAHSQSVNYCTNCHTDAPVPDGWLTASEASSLHQISESSE